MVVIKVNDFCIGIGITFVRINLDFHAYDFLSLEGLQLARPNSRALSPASWGPSMLKKSYA